MPGEPTVPLVAEIELSPAFHDLDPMDVVWHGHTLKYLELARCALLQGFDYDYPQMRASGYVWPIVDLRVKYVRPARLGQRLIVGARLSEWENRVRTDYQVHDAASGEVLTRGHSIQVAVEVTSGEMQFVCPPVLWQKFGLPAP